MDAWHKNVVWLIRGNVKLAFRHVICSKNETILPTVRTRSVRNVEDDQFLISRNIIPPMAKDVKTKAIQLWSRTAKKSRMIY